MNLRQLAELRCTNFGPDLAAEEDTNDSRTPAQEWFSFVTAARANDLARLWTHRLPEPERNKPNDMHAIGDNHVERLVAQAQRVLRLLKRHERDEPNAPLFAVQFDGVNALLDMAREHDKHWQKHTWNYGPHRHGKGSVGNQHFDTLVRVIARLRQLPIMVPFSFLRHVHPRESDVTVWRHIYQG